MWNGSWAADASRRSSATTWSFLPPPDFGNGPKIGGASWQWGMSCACATKDGAQEYLEVLARQPKYFVEYAKALGLIPANTDAAAAVAELTSRVASTGSSSTSRRSSPWSAR